VRSGSSVRRGSALSGESLRAISEREVSIIGRREALRGVELALRASVIVKRAGELMGEGFRGKNGGFWRVTVGGATGKVWPGLFSVAPVGRNLPIISY